MMFRNLFLVAAMMFLVLGTFTNVWAADDQAIAIQNLKAFCELTIIENGEATPKTMIVENMKPMRGTVDEIASSFLKASAGVFGINPELRDLSIREVMKSEVGQTVVYDQKIDNVPVYGSEIKVHVSSSRIVSHVGCFYGKGMMVRGASFSLNAEKAISSAKKTMVKGESLRTKPLAEKTWMPKNGQMVPAWRVKLSTMGAEPADWDVVVSAMDGSVLSRENAIIFAGSTGKGSVYKNHPLCGSVINVTLNNLDGTGALKGKYIYIVNEDTAGATSTNNEFIYGPDDTHFDEVMAYHQFNVVHDYFKDKYGFNKLDKALKATVHYGDKYDNAFFSPWEQVFAFGDGNRLNDLAKEAGVIFHEYVHCVIGAMASMSGGEPGAMNEAFSDYFAAVLIDNPNLGEWAVKKMGKPYLRTMENKAHYPEDIQNEVHYDSIPFSGALWDLRKSIDKDDCDKLVHFCRQYMPARAKYADGVAAIISADKDLCAGKYKIAIINAFSKRGYKAAGVSIASPDKNMSVEMAK